MLTSLFSLSFAQSIPAPYIIPGITATPSRAVLPQWRFLPGDNNAITDVPGISVGHVSIQKDTPHTLRTGVSAIIPHQGNLATEGVWAASSVLNGNGEMTGLSLIDTSGVLNSPILLTNTFSVGIVHQGVFQYFQKQYPNQWPGQLPVVGECYDGFFNTIEDLEAITPNDAVQAIESAKTGPLLQGRIGAGTGMRSFQLHSGIGSSSRTLMLNGHWYTVGVLVNANHSRLDSMNPGVRQALETNLGPLQGFQELDSQDQAKRAPEVSMTISPRQGSIIVIIATDLPLGPSELKQLSNRAALGIGAMGSTMDTSSGDFAIAFSTAQIVPLDSSPLEGEITVLQPSIAHPDQLTDIYRATVEAVTEAQMNALQASHSGITNPAQLLLNQPKNLHSNQGKKPKNHF